MFRTLCLLCLTCILLDPVLATDKGESLNKPIPEAARQSFARGLQLEKSDKFEEALAEFRKAMTIAPYYLRAHAEYVMADSYNLGREAQVRAEYEALMVKEPENPVYPMALELGQPFAPTEAKRAWLEKAAALAPEWAWGHYANARLAEQTQPEVALAESLKTIELARDAPQAYTTAISILQRLKRFDEADALAGKVAAGEDTRATGLLTIWRLRLARAGGSDEAKAKLKEELGRLASGATDIETLAAVYSAYTTLLKDKEGAKSIEQFILRVDPTWYPERGTFTFNFTSGRTGMRRLIQAGWQAHVANLLHEIDLDRSKTDPKEQVARLEHLLQLEPNADNRHDIQIRLLYASVAAADYKRTLNYGEALLKDDPEDVGALLALAKALTEQKADHARALAYARRGLAATAEFHPLERSPEVDAMLFDTLFSKERQQAAYKQQRAEALNTYASVLSQAGQYKEAEASLWESLAVIRTEDALSQLEGIVRTLGRAEEADKLAAELKTLWMTTIRINFKTEPAKDFEVSTLDGRKLKLSDLRGKTVIMSFWATWCVPCREEMPLLVELYKKYKSRGLEIVAVSSDVPEDRSKVVAFAREYKLMFPVAVDQSAVQVYGVNQYPTTNFIDRQGRLRYQSFGFDSKNGARDLEFVVEELLKKTG